MELCSYGAIVPLCPFEFPKAVRGPSPYLIATMELMNLGLGEGIDLFLILIRRSP